MTPNGLRRVAPCGYAPTGYAGAGRRPMWKMKRRRKLLGRSPRREAAVPSVGGVLCWAAFSFLYALTAERFHIFKTVIALPQSSCFR
jgi:hypothetical protein